MLVQEGKIWTFKRNLKMLGNAAYAGEEQLVNRARDVATVL